MAVVIFFPFNSNFHCPPIVECIFILSFSAQILKVISQIDRLLGTMGTLLPDLEVLTVLLGRQN